MQSQLNNTHRFPMPKANHREKILNAGLAVFHQQGFHNSGIQDIVNYAGVPKGSFYNHFESKDALGMEILQTYWAANADTRKMLHDEDLPALERMEQYLKGTCYSENGCLIGNFSAELSGSDPFRASLADLYQRWNKDIESCIRAGQKEGTIRDEESAKNLAEFVTTGFQGAVLKAKVDRDPKVLDRFRKSMLLFLKS